MSDANLKIYKLFDKVFRCEFRLYIGDLEEFKSKIRTIVGYPGDDAFTPAKGYCVNMDGAMAIWLPEFDWNNPSDMGCLCHEMLHAVHFRLHDRCEIEYWHTNAEVGCYYHEFLIREFLEKIKADHAKSNRS